MSENSLTEEELNIAIAKQLGYTVYHYNDLNPYFVLWDETGERVALDGERETEAEAWEDALEWSTNLNFAIDLLGTLDVAIYRHSIHLWKVSIGGVYSCIDASLPKCICLAWLEFSNGKPRYAVGDHTGYKGKTWQVFEVSDAPPPYSYRLESLDGVSEVRGWVSEGELGT